MDERQNVERGSHTELMALNGYYARLHSMQFEDKTPEGQEQMNDE